VRLLVWRGFTLTIQVVVGRTFLYVSLPKTPDWADVSNYLPSLLLPAKTRTVQQCLSEDLDPLAIALFHLLLSATSLRLPAAGLHYLLRQVAQILLLFGRLLRRGGRENGGLRGGDSDCLDYLKYLLFDNSELVSDI